MFSNILSPLLRILDTFKVDNNHAISLTNKALFEQITAHFARQLEERSVSRRMIYPMAFYIFIHPDDWTRRKDDLQLFIPEIVAKFYEIIYGSLDRYPTYTPPATHWFFQFSELTVDNVVTDNGERVALQERGKIYIMSRTFAPKLDNSVQEESSIKFSLCVKNSDIDSTVDINMDAIAKIDKRGGGVFREKFDMSLDGRLAGDKIQKPTNTTVDNAVDTHGPVLSWQMNGKNYRYTMTSKYLIVSGPHETRTGDNILKIDHECVKTNHLVIRWDNDKRQYIARAYAPSIINTREMTISADDAPVDYAMSRRSSLILGMTLKINFEYTAQ